MADRRDSIARWQFQFTLVQFVVEQLQPKIKLTFCNRGNSFGGMNEIQIAKVCHDANKSYCESIGDTSQVSWELAPGWQKDSALNGVRFIRDNPNAPSSASHDSWMAQKIAEGWAYGPVKDPAKKEHPCIIPYNGLPKEQQAKDALFGAIVRALL